MDLPEYHPFDDSFINDERSYKFVYTSIEDYMMNALDCSIEDPDLRYYAKPKKHKSPKKNKKYITKPKNHSKKYKLKAKRESMK